MHNQTAATELINVALDHVETLPPLWANFARGFEAYLTGRADTAVHFFEQAIELDSEWPEGWMGLGEAYQHMLPRTTPQDSLAKDAFQHVYARTVGYAPALYHLIEYALREGDLNQASRLLEEYRQVQPDSAVLGILELASACNRASPEDVDWQHHMTEDVNRVFQAGKLLGVGGYNPDCAIAAWRSILRYETPVTRAWSYSALLGLQSILVAMGRTEKLRALLDSAAATGSKSGVVGRRHYILDALAGADVKQDARSVASSLRGAIDTLGDSQLWSLGLWDVYQGDHSNASAVVDLLQARAEVGSRQAALVAAGLSAHLAAVADDTAKALRMLEELSPSAPNYAFLQYAHESLGFERLMQAKLLLARGRFEEARTVAEVFDSPGAASIVFPIFLTASLEVRLQAARALKDGRAVTRITERLHALGREDIVEANQH
jgi:tetratricopeptide (TPR) repeat protein